MIGKPKIGLVKHYGVRFRHYDDGPKYWKCIEQAGGRPVSIPPAEPREALRWARELDGLVLPGGMDVPPELYGQETLKTTYPAPQELVRLELALIEAFISAEKPILGICAGHQLLNVAFGGKLHQHIHEFIKHPEVHIGPRIGYKPHSVDIKPGSHLAELVGNRIPRVMSSHHQAVVKLGHGVQAVASTPDGIIEATQFPAASRVLSVQWHPEWTPSTPATKALFGALVAEADAHRQSAVLEEFLVDGPLVAA